MNYEYHIPFLTIDAPKPSVKLLITFREKDLLPLENLYHISEDDLLLIVLVLPTAAQLLLWDNNSSHYLDADWPQWLTVLRLLVL